MPIIEDVARAIRAIAHAPLTEKESIKRISNELVGFKECVETENNKKWKEAINRPHPHP